jgi:hypothetical protein
LGRLILDAGSKPLLKRKRYLLYFADRKRSMMLAIGIG